MRDMTLFREEMRKHMHDRHLPDAPADRKRLGILQLTDFERRQRGQAAGSFIKSISPVGVYSRLADSCWKTIVSKTAHFTDKEVALVAIEKLAQDMFFNDLAGLGAEHA